MKKIAPLLALALGSATAFAQSNVTLAGRVDMGVQNVNTGVNTTTRMDSGTYTASRLILRGNEDLGGGLSALFYLENRFNADTGAPQSASKFWNAGSYVGLSSKSYGTVTLGRQYSPIFWSFLFADDTGPLKLHGYSAVQSVQRSNFARIRASASPIQSGGTLDSVAGGVYSLGITSAFEDNLIVYKTPSFGGVTAMLAVELPEGYTAAGTGKLFSGNVEYKNESLYASVAASRKRGIVTASGATQTVSEQLASAMYAVTPNVKLWGNVHPWKMESTGNGELKGHDWMLGASYWFPSSELWVNYANKKISNCVACNSSGWGIGYHYFLSKRTELYTSLAKVRNGANSANSLNGFAPDDFGRGVRAFSVGLATTF
ncbi:MAG: porin [Acidovorax sp.]